MFSYSKLSSAMTQTIPPLVSGRHAAVAIILDDQQRLLMMQRAKHKDDPWSGHMGFPGGGYEKQDENIRVSAERECLEEVGIDLTRCAVFLGGLRRLSHPKITVDAFVYHLQESVEIIPNEEVADVFWISLHDLNDKQFKGTIDHVFQNTPRQFPAITLPDVPVPIWGISLGFINQALRIWSLASQ